MRNSLKSKKGFTLVELLAVIVILALIMSIAIYSISGILQSSRENTFKETALNIINGVRMQLTASNELKAGTYYFTNGLLDNDNNLSFGGKINYSMEFKNGVWSTKADNNNVVAGVGTVVPATNGIIYRAASTVNPTDTNKCIKTTTSYVTVKYENGKYEFSICLTPTPLTSTSQKFIKGTEADLFGNTATTIFGTE